MIRYRYTTADDPRPREGEAVPWKLERSHMHLRISFLFRNLFVPGKNRLCYPVDKQSDPGPSSHCPAILQKKESSL